VDGAERAVRSWLASGRFRHGDRLPPEQELAAMLSISRGTLRSALRRLEDSGEIVRRQGSGTFAGRIGVAPGFDRGLLRVDSYSAGAPGAELTVAELRIELRALDARAATALAVPRGRRSMRISRMLTVGDSRAALSHDVFHPEVRLPETEPLRAALHDGATMFQVLASTQTPPAFSRTKISTLLLTPLDTLGRRLALRAPTPCLMLEETVFGDAGQPLLFAWDVALPAEIEIEVVQSTDAPQPDAMMVRAPGPEETAA
jgi:DNA-binding GntR family transcriptional regulator